MASIPLTYLGIFDAVRALYASSVEARAKGFRKSHFSFLTAEGRCGACGGPGRRTISLDHLADVTTPCEVCRGKRYNREVLDVRVDRRSIADVLAMTAAEGAAVLAGVPAVAPGLALLAEIGLDYLQLGQSIDTLSSGERQRLKLVAELMRPTRGRALYLFDEPTAGLHPS